MWCCQGSTEINDVKYQALAVAIFLGQEARELIRRSQWRCAETTRNFTRGNRGNFEFGQAGNACLYLLRTVLQYCIHEWQTGGGVSQYFPFGDEADKLELVQQDSDQYLRRQT